MILGRLAKTAIQARKVKRKKVRKGGKTPERRRRKDVDIGSSAGDSSDAGSFSSSHTTTKVKKQKRKKDKRAANGDRISSTARKSRTVKDVASRFKRLRSDSDDLTVTNIPPVPHNRFGIGKERGHSTNDTNDPPSTTTTSSITFATSAAASAASASTSNYHSQSYTSVPKRSNESDRTSDEVKKNHRVRPRSRSRSRSHRNNQVVGLRPWYGDIDEEERKYLARLVEPRNHCADVRRLLEGRPAEFGESATKDNVSNVTSANKTGESTKKQELLTYIDTEQQHYKALWGHVQNPKVRSSLASVEEATFKLKGLLNRQTYFIEHLQRSLETARTNSKYKFEVLHERLEYLDSMSQENKAIAMNMVDTYKDQQKQQLATFESDFEHRISSTLEKARETRDDSITNPSLEYVKKRMQETQKHHEAAMRDGLVVRCSLYSGVVLLRMSLILMMKLILPVMVAFSWCFSCCEKHKRTIDHRMVTALERHLHTLEEYRNGDSTTKKDSENE